MENQFNGAILTPDTISERDFIWGGESALSVKLKIAYNPNKIFSPMDQGVKEWSWYTCTICSAFTMLMYNTGQVGKYTMDHVSIVADRMEKDGKFLRKTGAKLVDAIDYVRRYNNEVSDIKVDSFRLEIGSDEHKEAGLKNCAIQYGFFSSGEYQRDAQDDGIVSGVNFPHGGGHAVVDLAIKLTQDSYESQKIYNQYEIEQMITLKNNGVIFPSGYIFLKQTYSMYNDVSENSPFFPVIKEMNEKGIMKGADGKFRPKDNVTREEMAVIISRVLSYMQK